jgi:hypothetical protein
MRTGAVARWSVGRPPFVAIDHGVRDAIGYRDGARWALAFDDGTLVESPLTMRSLVDLRALLARVTTVRLR